MVTVPYLRPSSIRWLELAQLLAAFERCYEQCSRLDAFSGKMHNRMQAQNIDWRFAALQERVEREITALTVERIHADITQKKKQAAA